MPVGHFLPLALGVCEALAPLHSAEGCYGQLNPDTVFVCPPSSQVRLLDAGSPDGPAGDSGPAIRPAPALPYLAPEQSGRISQRLDARSDCYSLGMIFYELLTGALPFRADDPLGWVHAHLARAPDPPCLRNPDLPPALSDIVMKMLEKAPERRYQSIASLAADLARCWRQWQESGTILQFAVGGGDAGGRFRTLHHLYGREEELAAVVAACRRVAGRGGSELLLLSGPSGVGKSAVAEELEKQIGFSGGVFIAGKFDQYKRQMPYSTLCGALSQLAQIVLGSDDATLQPRRARLEQALDGNAALLFDMLPELRLLLGQQDMPPPLPPREAQRRLFATLRRFIGVFAEREHPLVIFLDDLQWSDGDTLSFLRYLLVDSDTPALLVIGTYRDNDITPLHPFTQALDWMRAGSLPLTEIRLAPLSAVQVAAMIADVLGIDRGRAAPLAALVHRKTAGIPLFALHFLDRLGREGHLRHDPAGGGWDWDLEAIHAQAYSDNVIDLMLDAMHEQLPDTALDTLRYAACIGYVADLGLLAAVRRLPEQAVRSALKDAQDAGFIELADRDTVRFAHDRIQQAVYALTPQRRRSAMHLEIARCLRAVLDADADAGDRIFDIADQYNLGSARIVGEAERRELLAVNLRAGLRAKQAGAHASASHYLGMGLKRLRPADFGADYRTAYSLYLEQASCCYLLGRTAEARSLLETVLQHTQGVADRARALHLKIELLSAITENAQALAALRECTSLFGIDIAEDVSAAQAMAEEARFWAALGERSIGSLADMPVRTEDDAWEFLLDSLLIATPLANVRSGPLFHLLVAHAVNVSLHHGSAGEAALSFALLGIVCCMRDEIDRTAQLEDLALRLLRAGGRPVPGRYQAPSLMAVGALLAPHTRPLREALADLHAAFDAARRSDEPVAANLACEYIVAQRCGLGEPLADIQQDVEARIDFAENTAYALSRRVLEAWRAYVRLLRGQARHPPAFDADDFDERQFEDWLEASFASPVHFVYYSLKLQSRFLFGDYVNALQAAHQARSHYRFSFSSYQRSEFHFYEALACAALCRTLDGDDPDRRQHLALLRSACDRLARWKAHCPANFSARHALACAELARTEGDERNAIAGYLRAIEAAAAQGAPQLGALAHELAADFWRGRGSPRLADTMVAAAIQAYADWGAEAKASQLRRRHPGLATAPESAPLPLTESAQWDLLAMAKAAQVIADEVTTGRLHETLLRILLEQVGAECAHLLVGTQGPLRLAESARYEGERFEVAPGAAWPAPDAGPPETVVNYVARARVALVLDDACHDSAFSQDPYFRARQRCAVLCLPIHRQQDLVGVLYLENSQLAGAFANVNLQVLEWLLAQVAISMENAALYAHLQDSEARLTAVMDNVPACVYMKDPQGRYLYVNREFEKIVGITLAETLGRDDFDILQDQPEVAEAVRKADLVAIRGETLRVEEQFVTADGTMHTFLSVKTPLYANQEVKGLCGISMDISEQKRARERIDYLAHYDLLTGLPNRNLLADRIEQALAEARRTGAQVGLMVLDLDRFKVINDSLGHRVGDLLLQEMASRLKTCVRDGDTVARLGGDSFVIIAPGLDDGEAARALAVKAGDSVAGPYRLGSVQAAASVCIGVSLFPQDTQDGGTLLQFAEMAMYQAKLQGHKSLRFYDEAMDQRAQERLRMENELRVALTNGELYLVYQPQVDLRDHHVAGAEALVRWRHPVLGLVSPARFIPLAEECGLISDITEWAINEVCAQMRRWRDLGLPRVSLAVNVSARNVQHDDLYHWVESALADADIDGGSLELEMTEGTLMTDMETSIEKLVALKRLGIRTSIDDFGTGYSSLSYLKRLPVDKLKIDQSFVRDIATNPNDAAITGAIIAMGRQLNLKVIAEGVEDSAAESFLLKHRCDQMQGYLFSPPVSAEAFAVMLG
jgi:diguanylate cyclase (GGDEF)-like protein/PAS domain S-box-containing protein